VVDIQSATINGQHSWFLEYVKEIRAGNIVIGNDLRMQLDNLLEDLESPWYVYDTKDAVWRMRFIEGFCKHTKSPFYGQPFILELWQKVFIEVFYSFKWTAEGYTEYYGEAPPKDFLRRFKKAILLVSRKNGKSSLCSAIAFTELMVGPPGSDIVCSSNDDKQARIIFDETGVMRQLFDPFGKRGTHKNLQAIFNYNTNSKMFRLSDRTSNKEGRNIDGAILDESHEMVDNIIAKSIEQSQSTKDEPWFINITTEGFVNDGYLDNELKYARAVLRGDVEDPTLLSFLYTQDSENEIWQDERSWMKSNPSLGRIKKRKYIIDQMNKARHDKGERLFMLTKDFNWKMAIGEAWLLPDELENPATFNIEDLRGAIGLGGVDLSETTDLCAAKLLVMRPGDNTKYVIQKYWIPEARVEAGSKEDKQNYLEWARQGLLEISPGNENDFRLITQWFVRLVKEFNIRPFKIGIDRWQAHYLIRELEETGFDCVKLTFNKKTVSNPMKLCEADLKSKLVNYNDNPIDRWCLSNVGLEVDSEGLIFPVKVQGLANKRIDGAVALIICYIMYQWNRTEYLQIIR
jgi:phage terminase large subunit-like protein